MDRMSIWTETSSPKDGVRLTTWEAMPKEMQVVDAVLKRHFGDSPEGLSRGRWGKPQACRHSSRPLRHRRVKRRRCIIFCAYLKVVIEVVSLFTVDLYALRVLLKVR